MTQQPTRVVIRNTDPETALWPSEAGLFSDAKAIYDGYPEETSSYLRYWKKFGKRHSHLFIFHAGCG